MGVYVDDWRAEYRGMLMCHMAADTSAELLAMAEKIGVQRKWIQKAGTPWEHFDVCLSKRDLAVKFGAKLVSAEHIARLSISKREKENQKSMTQTRLTPFTATLLAMSLLFQTACTTPTVNKYVIAVDGMDALITALEIADPNPTLSAIGNAAEGCGNTLLPLLEAGGSIITIGQQALPECKAALYPVIPAGTDQTIANDITAVAQDVFNFFQASGITLPPLGSPAPTANAMLAMAATAPAKATWTPSAGDKAQLAKARAKMAKWKPIPVKQSRDTGAPRTGPGGTLSAQHFQVVISKLAIEDNGNLADTGLSRKANKSAPRWDHAVPEVVAWTNGKSISTCNSTGIDCNMPWCTGHGCTLPALPCLYYGLKCLDETLISETYVPESNVTRVLVRKDYMLGGTMSVYFSYNRIGRTARMSVKSAALVMAPMLHVLDANEGIVWPPL